MNRDYDGDGGDVLQTFQLQFIFSYLCSSKEQLFKADNCAIILDRFLWRAGCSLRGQEAKLISLVSTVSNHHSSCPVRQMLIFPFVATEII